MRLDKTSRSIRSGYGVLLGAMMLLPCTGAFAQERPAMTIRQGQLVTPDVSIPLYGSATARTFSIQSLQDAFNAGTRPVQVRELARGLGSQSIAPGTVGAGQISQDEYANRAYEYVRQNLRPVFIFGQQKGSLGALLDQAGTSFDQSNLLVDLLREGGISPTFQLGTISLTRTQFSDWTGITNPAAACRLLADGGIPAQVNGNVDANCSGISSPIDTVMLRHMWVSANVRRNDGTSDARVYDPTYKRHIWVSGIDLPAAMGCGTTASPTCGNTVRNLLPATTTISGAPAYTGINTAGLEGQFRTFATNLLNDLRGRASTLTLQDTVGGPRIDTASITTPTASLPYTTSAISTLSEIPDQYRIRFRVQFAGMDKTVFSDELAGKRLRVLGDVGPDNSNHSATAFNISLYAEYEIIASNNGALASPGTNPLVLTVDHPYVASNLTYMDTSTLIDTYTLENDTESDISNALRFRFNPFTIVNAWGPTGKGSVAHFGDLQAKNLYRLDVVDKENPAHTWSRCQPYPLAGFSDLHVDEGDFLRYACLRLEQPSMAINWLSQNEQMLDLVGRANASEISTHHVVGTVISGIYWPASINMDSALTISSRSNNTGNRQAASFSVSSMSARLEGSIIEQATGTSLGMSSPSVIDMANQKGNSLISANLSTFDGLRSTGALTGYPSFVLDRIRSTYIANGYTVLLPKEWILGFFPVSPGSQSGITFNFGGYFAYRPTGDRTAYIVAYDKKGTASFAPIDPTADVLKGMDGSGGSMRSRNFHRVDLSSGALSITPAPDLVTGSGAFPQSLSFQRTYSSSDPGLPQSAVQRDTRRGLLAHAWEPGAELRYGWDYNLNMRGSMVSDYSRAMGASSAEDASIAIATVAILRDLQRTSSSFATEVTSTYLANWWGKTLPNNAFVASVGAASDSFLRLADGTYSPQSRNGAKLVRSATGETTNWYVFPRVHFHFTWDLTASDGSIIRFIQDTTRDLNTPGDGAGAASPQSQTYYPQKWTFPTGAILDFEYDSGVDDLGVEHWNYCLKEVRNNYGRKIKFNYAFRYRQAEGYCIIGNVEDDTGRTVSFEDDQEGGGTQTWNPTDHTYTVTLPDGSMVSYHYRSTTDEPGTARAVNVIDSWAFGPDVSNPFAQVTYDELFRVASIRLATNNDAGTLAETRYAIGGLSAGENMRRGESRDPLGAQNTVYFGKFGEQLQSINALGQVTSNTYDSRVRLKKATFPEGNSLEYEYDARNNTSRILSHAKPGSSLPDAIQQWTYVEGPTVTTCANHATCNMVATEGDFRGNVISYAYNPDGQVRQITFPTVNGEVPRTNYCYSNINGIAMLDARVDSVATTVPKPDRVGRYAYNAANHYVLDRVTIDPVDSKTADCANATRTGARNQVTAFTFDALGNVRTVDGPRGDGIQDVQTFEFDVMRRVKKLDAQLDSDPAYASTQYEYTPDGALFSVSRKEGATWQTDARTYWPSGELKRYSDAEGNQTNYFYDGNGKTTLVVDPEGRGSGAIYDLLGRPTCEWRGITNLSPPVGCAWNPANYAGQGAIRYNAYEYSANGRLKRVYDANNNYIENFYDNLDRLRITTFPNGADGTRCTLNLPSASSRDTANPACTASGGTSPTYELFSYTVDGTVGGARCGGNDEVCRKRTRRGTMTTFGYDALDRLISRTVTGMPAISYTYNLMHEPRTISSPAGTVNGASVPAHSISYDYDDAGNRLFEENLIGGALYRISYLHDKAGNRTRVTWPDGYFAAYQYDDMSRLEYVRENSETANELARYYYDQLSRTTGQRFAGSESNKINYTYEPDSNLDTITNVFSAGSLLLDYDRNKSGQVRSITSNDSFSLTSPAGISTTPATTAYVPNNLNQYAFVGGTATSHDANGNLLTMGQAPNQNIYTYDVESRLRTARIGTGPLTRYNYDPLGRRISKTVGSTTTYFLPDGENEASEYGSGGLLRRYVGGVGRDERIAIAEGDATSDPPKSYFRVNHQRSVIAMTDAAGRTSNCAAGVMCQQMAYDVYGNLVAGPTTGPAYRYTGRRFDEESGLYYYRARYYSPQIGRFLQADPIGFADDVNLYSYVKNDPANLIDPSGTNCANMSREGLSAVDCIDAGNTGPTPAQANDAILTPQLDASATTGTRPTETGIFKKTITPGTGFLGNYNKDAYEHGAVAITDATGNTVVWIGVPGESCENPNVPGTQHTEYDSNFLIGQGLMSSKIKGAAKAFMHEHGGYTDIPHVGDYLIPKNFGIPLIMLGENVVVSIELSGGMYRGRVLSGAYTGTERKAVEKMIKEWQNPTKPPYTATKAKPQGQPFKNCVKMKS